MPSSPAGQGLARAAPAASARLSALSTETRNRSSAVPVTEGKRLPSSRRMAAKNPPTAGGHLACPLRRRFSLWYVEKVILVLFDTATMAPLLIRADVILLKCPERVWGVIHNTCFTVGSGLIHYFYTTFYPATPTTKAQKPFNTNHILQLFTPQPLKAYQFLTARGVSISCCCVPRERTLWC